MAIYEDEFLLDLHIDDSDYLAGIKNKNKADSEAIKSSRALEKSINNLSNAMSNSKSSGITTLKNNMSSLNSTLSITKRNFDGVKKSMGGVTNFSGQPTMRITIPDDVYTSLNKVSSAVKNTTQVVNSTDMGIPSKPILDSVNNINTALGKTPVKAKIDIDDKSLFGETKATKGQAEQYFKKSPIKADVDLDMDEAGGGNPLVDFMKKLMPGFALFSIYQVGQVLKRAFNSALDAVESDSLFNTTFGSVADDARAWSEQISQSLGVNPFETRKASAYFMNMYRGFDLTQKEALDLSKSMTELSHDMASYFNTKSIEDAQSKLKSVLAGEVRPMKQWGIILDEATIKTYAIKNGWLENNRELTQHEKLLIRSMLLYENSKKMSFGGDMRRTITSPMNQIRILMSQIQVMFINVGRIMISALMPVLPVIGAIIKALSALLGILATIFQFLAGITSFNFDMGFDNSQATNPYENVDMSQIEKGTGAVADNVAKTATNAKKARKEFEKWLSPFDEIIKIDGSNLIDNAGGGAGGGGGAGAPAVEVPYPEYPEGLNEVFKLPKWLESILNLIKPLMNSFKIFLGLLVGLTIINNLNDGGLKKIISGIDELVKKNVVLNAFKKALVAVKNTWILLSKTKGALPMLAGLSLLAGSFLYLYENNEAFRKSVDTWIKDFKTSIQDLSSKVAKWLEDMGFAKLAEDIRTAFGDKSLGTTTAFAGLFVGAILVIANVVKAVSAIIEFFSKLFKPLAKGLNTTTKASKGLSGWLVKLGKGFGIIGIAMFVLLDVIPFIVKNWDTIKDKAVEFWEAVVDGFDFFKKSMNGVMDFLGGILQWFVDLAGNVSTAMVRFVFEVVNKFIELNNGALLALNNIVTFFSNLGATIIKYIINIPREVTNIFNILKNDVLLALSGILTWFGNLGVNIIGLIITLPTTISDVFTTVKNRVLVAVAGILSWFGSLGTNIYNAITSIPGKVSGIFETAKTSSITKLKGILDWFNRLGTNIINSLIGIPGKVKIKFEDIRDSAIDGVKGILTWFKDLPGAIAKLLKDLPGKISKAFGSILPSWLKNFLGLSSFDAHFTSTQERGVSNFSSGGVAQPPMLGAFAMNPLSLSPISGGTGFGLSPNIAGSSMNFSRVENKLTTLIDIGVKLLNVAQQSGNSQFESDIILDGEKVGKGIFKRANRASKFNDPTFKLDKGVVR